MATFSFAVMAVLPLFLMIFIGYFLRVFHVFKESFFNEVTRFCFKVAMPCLIFKNIYSSNLDVGSYVPLVVFGITGIISLAVIGCLFIPLTVKDQKKKGVMVQNLFRANFFFFGIPMITNIFGEEHIGPAVMMVAFVVPIFNILGAVVLAFFQEHEGKKRVDFKDILHNIFTNPIIIGAIIAFLFVLLKIPLFDFVVDVIGDIADVTTTIALISLGGTFKFQSAKHNMPYIIRGVLDKLFLVPAIMLTIAVILGFRGPELAICLALFGAPGAVASFVMAKEAGADGELAGQLIVFTTAFAFVSLVFFIFILRSLGFI